MSLLSKGTVPTNRLIHGADCCSCWSYCSCRLCLDSSCWLCSGSSDDSADEREEKRDFSLRKPTLSQERKRKKMRRLAAVEMTVGRGSDGVSRPIAKLGRVWYWRSGKIIPWE